MLRRAVIFTSTMQMWVSVLVTPVLLGAGNVQPACDPSRDLHTASICQLTLGMTPAQVLDTMRRPPDAGQEQAGDIVSGWKLPGGNLLTVRFRKKQYVSALSLD